MAGEGGQTADHRVPEAAELAVGSPSLVCAFPAPHAVAIATLGRMMGRRQLREHGITDSEISSEHASIERVGGALALRDLGSRNGTFVDGHRLAPEEPVVLVDGAIVRIGRSVFVYRERFRGAHSPSMPLGRLVAPFGLRDVALGLDSIVQRPAHHVLIEGETGTGKELLAHHVAEALGRAQPYAAVNVAGIAAGVFESQLFGHVAGAYSDARHASPGVLTAHEKGAVFLDEIGCLASGLQSKLLRLLDQGDILPVGASNPRKVDVLIVAATNESLETCVANGTFRADLLARLSLARLELPPLRERAEDLYAIARHLADRHRIDLDPDAIEVEAIERLMLHDWRRNVRELEAFLRQSAALDGRPGLRSWAVNRILGDHPAPRSGLLSEAIVADALAAESGNETAAARRLGVTRGRLRRFLARKESNT